MHSLNVIKRLNNEAVLKHEATQNTHYIEVPGGVAVRCVDGEGRQRSALLTGAQAKEFLRDVSHHDGATAFCLHLQAVCRDHVARAA